jgi:RNA polymerase sporulation-specific sigma factor
VNIPKTNLLSKELTNKLISEYQKTNDKNIRDQIINSNLRLVLKILHRYYKSFSKIGEDLFQVGCIGLIKAVDRFDLTKNVRFSTYAVSLIIGEIQLYLRDNRLVKYDRISLAMSSKVKKMKNEWEQKYHREPSADEIMDKLCISEKLLKSISSMEQETLSLCETFGDDNNCTLLNYIAKYDDYSLLDFEEKLQKLSPKEKNIIIKMYIEGKKQHLIARELNIAQPTVSKIQQKAIQKLKTAL